MLWALPPALVQPQANEDGRTLMTRIRTLTEAKDWQGLADLFETLSPRTKGGMLTNYEWALLKAERHAHLLAVCENALPQLEPDGVHKYSETRYFRAKALAGLGRHREAMEAFGENGDLGSTIQYLAACSEATCLSDWPSLERHASAMVRKLPGNWEALGLQGQALAKQAKFDQAEAILRASLALKAEQPMTLADLACVLNEKAEYEAALDAAEKAVALDPRLLEAQCNRARALTGLKRYPEGRASYAAALALDPQDPALVASLRTSLAELDQILAPRPPRPSGHGKK